MTDPLTILQYLYVCVFTNCLKECRVIRIRRSLSSSLASFIHHIQDSCKRCIQILVSFSQRGTVRSCYQLDQMDEKRNTRFCLDGLNIYQFGVYLHQSGILKKHPDCEYEP